MERLGTPALARIIVHIYIPSVLMGFGLGMFLPTLTVLARNAKPVGVVRPVPLP